MTRPSRMTGAVRAVALTVLVGFAISTPLGGRAVGRACAAGNMHVAVIVDLGSGASVSALCVPASSNEDGEALLSARASMLGTPQPRYNSAGLLCAIDGIPSTGCGVTHDGGYAYWSYWHGTGGSWSYSSIGPGFTRVDSAVVEGWRWQPDGTAHPSDPAPRGPARATSVCITAPPAPTTTPKPTVTAANSVEPTVPIRPTTELGPAPAAGGAGSPTTRLPATNSPSSTSVSSTAQPTVTAASPTTHRGATAARISPPTSVDLVPRGIAAAPEPHSSGGVPVGGIVAAALCLALVGAGAFTARRRRGAGP